MPKEVSNDDDSIDVDALRNAQEYINVVDVLHQLGVDPIVACRFVNSVRKAPSQTFMELFGQGRIVEAAAHGGRRSLNVTGLSAIDLRTKKPNGDHWDLSRREDQQLVEDMIDEQKPDWLIGSPPCTAYIQLNWGVELSQNGAGQGAEHAERSPGAFAIRYQDVQ